MIPAYVLKSFIPEEFLSIFRAFSLGKFWLPDVSVRLPMQIGLNKIALDVST
jgi:hypothetical protein